MPSAEFRDLENPEGDASERLDRFLTEGLGVSRAEARRLLDAGAVLINGRAVGRGSKSRPIAIDDRVQIRMDLFPSPGRAAEPFPIPEIDQPLEILERGTGWVAVGKPAGVPVHPYRVDERGCVLNALVAREPGILGVGEGGLRSGVVHRLDVETSGVLLFATEAEIWDRARNAFRHGKVRKRYRALVHGRLKEAGDVEFDLYVAQHRPARVRVAKPGGQEKCWPTSLAWRVVETFEDATLVEVIPKTGFLHQIRVTLAELGHPVLGDAIYRASGAAVGRGARSEGDALAEIHQASGAAVGRGARSEGDALAEIHQASGAAVGRGARHMLHAAFLEIPTIEGLKVASPDAEDFRDVLDALRCGRPYSDPRPSWRSTRPSPAR